MSAGVWVALVVLLLVNAFYVAAEFGAVGVRRSRLRRLADDGNRLAAGLLPHVADPVQLNRYVAASQIGITACGLLLGTVAEATLAVRAAGAVAHWFPRFSASAASIATVCILVALSGVEAVVSELVPKSIALQYPTGVALATVLPMRWSLAAFKPLIGAISGATAVVLRVVGFDPTVQRHVHAPDEIELLIAESRHGGLLEPDEERRLHRALHLGLRHARDLMVPLDRLTMVAVDASWDETVGVVLGSPYSRLPVYRGARDQIVGLLRVKDLVHRFVAAGPAPIASLVRPLARVREDLAADRVLAALRERRTYQAAVVDASGRAVGLITIQDLLVALVGEGGAA